MEGLEPVRMQLVCDASKGVGMGVFSGTGNNDDTVDGKSGNDQLFGEGGCDTLNGGPGQDILDNAKGDNCHKALTNSVHETANAQDGSTPSTPDGIITDDGNPDEILCDTGDKYRADPPTNPSNPRYLGSGRRSNVSTTSAVRATAAARNVLPFSTLASSGKPAQPWSVRCIMSSAR